MLRGEKILVTGVTGKIAFPIARALAEHNEVWGASRLRNPQAIEELAAAGITPLALDMSTGDFSAVPDDFTYVFHAAVDPGTDDWERCLETNAHNSGELIYHCRTARGFVLCSTGSVYGYPGRGPDREYGNPERYPQPQPSLHPQREDDAGSGAAAVQLLRARTRQ